jgi:sodium ion-translocating decarboxylase beta subunit
MNDGLLEVLRCTGVSSVTWPMAVMWVLAGALLYLGIVRRFHGILLVPLACGALLANLPMHERVADASGSAGTGPAAVTDASAAAAISHPEASPTTERDHGLLDLLARRMRLDLCLPLILLGVGALTDFGPMLAMPRAFVIGAAAQIGLFGAFVVAGLFGFGAPEAATIGVLASADGPTSLFVATKLAPDLLAGAAFSVFTGQCLLPVIQPWLLRRLTSEQERRVRMRPLRNVSRVEKLAFALLMMIVGIVLFPGGAPLIAMLMLGNFLRECGVGERMLKTGHHEVLRFMAVFLGITVGLTLTADRFLRVTTLEMLVFGLAAMVVATVAGVGVAKIMARANPASPLNPLIGGAGVAAVPAAACVAQRECQKSDPANIILLHAAGANLAGLLGTIMAAGYFISTLR